MTVLIPMPLRSDVGGSKAVEVDAGTVAAALDGLTGAYPGLRNRLFTAGGKLRVFVNLYLNDKDVRALPDKEATAVKPTDTLFIIPSITGSAGNDICAMRVAS
jgi:adenylyltransferase/sulfurtransferase